MQTDKKNIKEELKELAPTLSKLVERNPFSLPEGYFENKERNLINNITSQAHIDAIGKGLGFLIPDKYFETLSQRVLDRLEFAGRVKEEKLAGLPDNYFDELPERVMDRIRSKEASQEDTAKNIRWLTFPRAVAIAAAFAGIVIALTVLLQQGVKSSSTQYSELDGVSTDELHQYVENHIQTYGMENLETIVEDSETSIYKSDFSEEEIETEELEEYLKEDIDLTTIQDLL